MKYLLLVTLLIMLDRAQAQSHVQSTGLPEVFLIGEYEDRYLDLANQYPRGLMDVFQNDIDKAYAGWSEFLLDIEDYSQELNFDIKGVKLWVNVYFNPDGTISNLAFFPKPNSRNVPQDQLLAFFKSFVNQYRFLESSETGFQHSTSASFPTFFHRTDPATAKNN